MQGFLKYAAAYGREEEQTIYIYPDSHGYYKVVVEKERAVPTPYRCYKIKEKVDIGKADGPDGGESHWVFYKVGMFDDLKKGDVVFLKVGKTERRHFQDIGWARNIYPDEMYADV